MQQAAFTFSKAMEELDMKGRINVWESPAGLSIMQMFPFHIHYHPSTHDKKISFCGQVICIPVILWTPCCRLRFDMFDFRFRPAKDCGAFDLEEKISNVSHGNFGCDVFSGCPFGAGEIVRFYNGSLVSSSLTTQKEVRETYGDCSMSSTVDKISLWMLKVSKTFLIAREKKEAHGLYRPVFVACDILTIVATFLQTSPQRFRIVCNH